MSRKPIRIAVLYFCHETVTFLKNDTTLDDFTYPGSPAAGEALLAHDARSYMGGFVKVAREFDGVELVGIESPLWPRTGTGSGWITQEAYETFLGRMIAALEAGGTQTWRCPQEPVQANWSTHWRARWLFWKHPLRPLGRRGCEQARAASPPGTLEQTLERSARRLQKQTLRLHLWPGRKLCCNESAS